MIIVEIVCNPISSGRRSYISVIRHGLKKKQHNLKELQDMMVDRDLDAFLIEPTEEHYYDAANCATGKPHEDTCEERKKKYEGLISGSHSQ